MTADTCFIVLVGRRNGARRALRRLGWRYAVVDASDDMAAVAAGLTHADAVVAVTEAAVLPAARLREHLGGCGLGVAAARRCTDKLEMKCAIREAGLPCADFVPVHGSLDARQLERALGLPLVLKTRTGSGGRGARVVTTIGELPRAVDVPHLAERFVSGTEMSVETLVVDGVPVFVNFTEYVEPRWANLVPAALDAGTADQVAALNSDAIGALGIDCGITHMEVFLTDDGPVFGELGARPPGGMLMRLIELAYGFDPWRALLLASTGADPQIRQQPLTTAAVRLLHPGEGLVRAVHGLDAVRRLPCVESVTCKLAPGDTVGPREGTGQHTGYVLLTGERAAVRGDLAAVGDRIRIDIEPS